jgi:NAD(P)H-dependent FMN reductase
VSEPESSLKVLCVIGTSAQRSVTDVVLRALAHRLRSPGVDVDIFDQAGECLPLFNPETSFSSPQYLALKRRVDRTDVFVLGTPDYHGCMSSTLKNFLDHFWREFAGRLFAPVVVSHEKGLTVIDQICTAARQCYAWTLPYGISVDARADVADGQLKGDVLPGRLVMLADDIQVYGRLLAHRRSNTDGTSAGFLARHQALNPPEPEDERAD